MEEEKLNNNKRDYDENPIIMKDRMPEISFWGIMIFIIIGISVINIFIPTGKNVDENNIIIYFLIAYIPTFYFIKSRIKEHRNIIFYTDHIVREWDDESLKLNWKDIVKVNRSFIDYYNKSQRVSQLYVPFLYILLPISFLLQHSTLIAIKYIYKLLKGFSNKSLFDTVVVFDEDDNMITTFISTNELKDELNTYFLEKGYGNIDDLPIFYTNQYSPDELTNYFNKKDN